MTGAAPSRAVPTGAVPTTQGCVVVVVVVVGGAAVVVVVEGGAVVVVVVVGGTAVVVVVVVVGVVPDGAGKVHSPAAQSWGCAATTTSTPGSVL